MFRLLRNLVLLILLLAAVAVVARNTVGAWALQFATQQMSGFPVSIGSLDVRLTEPVLTVRSVLVRNPTLDFQEPLAMKIQAASLRYDPLALLRGVLHIRRMELEVSEINLIRSAGGKTNFHRNPRPSPMDARLRVDELLLSLETVRCLNEPTDAQPPLHHRLNIRRQEFHHLQGFEGLGQALLTTVRKSVPADHLPEKTPPLPPATKAKSRTR